MDEEMITAINPTVENQIYSIDEEKLPQVFTEQIHFLEKANNEYNRAEEMEKKARKKVKAALLKADELIEAAKRVGGHAAAKKRFLWAEWTSERDEINAIKHNLREIIDHSEDSAEAQKKLAEVQSSLMESQTAVLQVNKAQMEYQRQIANATKFIFGLSAYNMATSQSILIKLKAILSGASEEQLGQLAQQQLFLALDQIRNQENIITRINENDDLIKNLNFEIEKKQREIDEIGAIDEKQNMRISENAHDIDQLEKQEEAQDKLIAVGIEKDREHDEKISENARDIDELESRGEEQDKRIADITGKIDEHVITLDKHFERDAELERKIRDVSQDTAEMIMSLKKSITENADIANNNIVSIENKFEKQIRDISENINKSNNNVYEQLTKLSAEFNSAVNELKGELKNQKEEINFKIDDIEKRINSLEMTVSKKVWKIAVTALAVGSVLLNVLHIIGVINV